MPGSRRLPYYQFEPGRFTFDLSRDGEAERSAAEDWDRRHCERCGLAQQSFTCRRGEVLIWHHSLLHGGSLPVDPALTRKSFVVHYSTLSSMRRVQNSYLEAGADDGSFRHLTSERILSRDGCRGFDSPLHAHSLHSGEQAG